MQNHMTIALKGDLLEIRRIAGLIENFGNLNRLPDITIRQVNLAVDELLTNTIFYGFDDAATDHSIKITLRLDATVLTVELVDDGKPFDPFECADPDLTKAIEDRLTGGLGIFLARKLMDSVDYQRVDGENRVTLIKRTIASTP